MNKLPVNQIIQGDCVEVLQGFPENSVDLVVTKRVIRTGWDNMFMVLRKCPICGNSFTVDPSRIKHGRGITCSKQCQNIHVSKKLRKGKTIKCPVCEKKFYCSPSRLQNAKYTPVCSRECLYEGRRKGVIGREVKEKYKTSPTIVTKICEQCGISFDVELTNKDHKYCSRECFLKVHKKTMSGSNNPSWIDGRSYDKRSYRGKNWDKTRKMVYRRDEFVCQICGKKCIGRRDLNMKNSEDLIQCHHIEKYEKDKKNNGLSNLITVCVSCHGKIHGGELSE